MVLTTPGLYVSVRRRPPAPAASTRLISQPPQQFADKQTIAAGMGLFHRYCSGCHGGRAVSGGVLPDLRMSAFVRTPQSWASVVLNGALQSRGMIGFAKELSDSNAEAIRAYVIDRANSDYASNAME